MRKSLSYEWRRVGTDPVPSWACFSVDDERYLGCEQNLENPVNDRFGCLFARLSVELR
jgi:hypothetical protein